MTNLDGLDDASLARFPSLHHLRDALYSTTFRTYLSDITGAGVLSGQKTDMAINVYRPGCHLLCHDDVIGSRRVSYILYLTDPDRPWKEEWGGALRLYPTVAMDDNDDGQGLDDEGLKMPSPDHSVSIPPAFGQLSFFAVQPGKSFHDVGEVYASPPPPTTTTTTTDEVVKHNPVDEERTRIAISGWYHIPQEGEEGYIPGLEEQLAKKSSLMQLQGKASRFDRPEPKVCYYGEEEEEDFLEQGKGKGKAVAVATSENDDDEGTLSEKDLEFLLRYIAPTYLTPQTLEEACDRFADESCLQLETFLSKKFSDRLREYIEREEQEELPGPRSSKAIEEETDWRVARPPHKHRYLYQPKKGRLRSWADSASASSSASPLQEILTTLLPSISFRKWLLLATGLELMSYNVLARRFRRGMDYTLATTGGGDDGVDGGNDLPRLEMTLCLTPTGGWGDDVDDDRDGGRCHGEDKDGKERDEKENGGVGGHEVYMSADDDDDCSDHHAFDPAIYRSGNRPLKRNDDEKEDEGREANKENDDGDDEDDGILFSVSPAWNRLSLVLRDQGVLRFVKYVSRAARGDRWDVTADFGIIPDDDDGGGGDVADLEQSS